MIFGIGTDIIEIDRIKKAIESEGFVKKVFCDEEISYLKDKNFSPFTSAGMFAAKEAVSKALGTGFSGFTAKDICINHEKNGKPVVQLLNEAKEYADKEGIKKIHLSISHSKDNAIAFAAAEK